MFQKKVTYYTINSFFEACASTAADIDISSIAEKFFNISLTTNSLGYLIPDIVNTYGKQNCTLTIKMGKDS